uniref:Uncharacterized protein n=1 Tax=Glossina pallidipes TaxID=7398 RepID=A0A1B0ACU1_GLOPL
MPYKCISSQDDLPNNIKQEYEFWWESEKNILDGATFIKPIILIPAPFMIFVILFIQLHSLCTKCDENYYLCDLEHFKFVDKMEAHLKLKNFKFFEKTKQQKVVNNGIVCAEQETPA